MIHTDVKWKIHYNPILVRNRVKDAIFAGIKEVFEGAIVQEARAGSPKGTEDLKPGGVRNADAIHVDTFFTRDGHPMAKIWTESGHGGFLETGTVNQGPQPYIWPAFQRNLGAIQGAVRAQLQALSGKGLASELTDFLGEGSETSITGTKSTGHGG